MEKLKLKAVEYRRVSMREQIDGHSLDAQEKNIRMSLLEEAMTELSDRERHILTERRLKDEPTTLEDLASQYGVSRERVRQIEVRAFEKLQKAMKNMVVEAAAQPSHRPVLGAIA